jgi:hypothetical protein
MQNRSQEKRGRIKGDLNAIARDPGSESRSEFTPVFAMTKGDDQREFLGPMNPFLLGGP